MATSRAKTRSTVEDPEGIVTEEDMERANKGNVELYQGTHYSDDELRGVTTFADFARLAEEKFGEIALVSDVIGDGFALLKSDDEKRALVGRPVIFLEWSFYSGDFGDKFVAARVVVQNKDGGVSKYILNDGSTGICQMLYKYSQASGGRTGGLVARNGLRVSEYTYCAACGTPVKPELDGAHSSEHKSAQTYYIDTSV